MLDFNTTMDALGARLLTISGLRVYDFLADSVAPPAAVVALPEITYDFTKGRGTDRVVFPVHVLISKVSDRASRDKYGAYAVSVKAAVDGTLGGTVHTARVVSAIASIMSVAGTDYLAATFNVEVID